MTKGVKDIGMGLVGTGMGSLLLPINRDTASRIQIRGICEPDANRQSCQCQGQTARALGDGYGVEFVTARYEDLLARRDIDCVGIFSPCPLHAQQIAMALEAGKHVLVTKPMAVSLEEARQVVALVKRTGKKLLVAQSMRWNSFFSTIHDLFQEGALGEIRLAEAYYVHDLRPVLDTTPWRYQMPQDYMYGGVCHPADLLRWFLGEVDEVFAYGSHGGIDHRYPPDRDNNFIISLKYRNGVIARILGAYDLIHPPRLWNRVFHGVGIGLYGTKASVFNDRIVYDYYGKGEPREEPIVPKRDDLDHAHEVFGFLGHFEECLIHDKPPLLDERDGAQIVAICAACWESIRTGRPVKVTREFDRN